MLFRSRGEQLASARPTAVNLRWAVERGLRTIESMSSDTAAVTLGERLLAEARAIHDEDRRLCAAIGGHGAAILPAGGVLTHCNTGALATGGDGTALAVITTAWQQGRRFDVFADETRPLFQGARLTAWELVQRGIPVTVLADAAAAHLMKSGRVAAVIVGADRITACGDTANKIGTYGLAVLAAAHGVPFFVAAPSSTFDLSIESGDDIPIEERSAREVTHPLGVPAAPDGAGAFNPAFDVTPARLIKAIITEHGVISPVAFLPAARRAGLMAALSEVIARQALRDHRQRLDAGIDLRLAVNCPPAEWPVFLRHMECLATQHALTLDAQKGTPPAPDGCPDLSLKTTPDRAPELARKVAAAPGARAWRGSGQRAWCP